MKLYVLIVNSERVLNIIFYFFIKVLQQAASEMLNYKDLGFGVMGKLLRTHLSSSIFKNTPLTKMFQNHSTFTFVCCIDIFL